MKKTILCVGLLMMSLSAFAQYAQDYYQIKSVVLSSEGHELKEIQLNADAEIYGVNPLMDAHGLPQDGYFVEKSGGVGEVIAVANQIIALGEKIYKIIEKGKPVLQTAYAPISVIPKAKDGSPVDMFQTSNWSRPVTRSYEISYKNGFNMSVVKFKFTLIFSYGGKYLDKGKYITAAQIVPSDVEVAWGYSVSATMNLDSIMNHGSIVDPLAGANLRLNYKIDTVVKAEERNILFYIGGDGKVSIY